MTTPDYPITQELGNGNKPAYPSGYPVAGGLTKREAFAKDAPVIPEAALKHRREMDFQRVKNDPSCTVRAKNDIDLMTEWAVEWADALLKALAAKKS